MSMNSSLLRLCFAGLLSWSLAVNAGAGCDSARPSIHCGTTPSAVWQQDRLWAVFAFEGRIYLTSSDDKGQSFAEAVPVNRQQETLDVNGENRPKIQVTPEAILVTWTQKTQGRFTGNIRLARSTDGGRTFEPPRTLNDDGLLTSHRFDSLLAYPDGTVYVVWLDKREQVAATDAGSPYPGSAVYAAVSRDHGKTFAKNFAVASNSCECCRIALAPGPKQSAAIFWRHIYEIPKRQVRDHAFALLTPTGTVRAVTRATFDDWELQACPHHGPALAQASETAYHLAWFSNGNRQSGIHYARLESSTGQSTNLFAVDTRPGASHPQIATQGGDVIIIWKFFDGEHTHILQRLSNDGGNHWSEPVSLLRTAGASDHPSLITLEQQAVLAWHTEGEGYRIAAAAEPRTRAEAPTP